MKNILVVIVMFSFASIAIADGNMDGDAFKSGWQGVVIMYPGDYWSKAGTLQADAWDDMDVYGFLCVGTGTFTSTVTDGGIVGDTMINLVKNYLTGTWVGYDHCTSPCNAVVGGTGSNRVYLVFTGYLDCPSGYPAGYNIGATFDGGTSWGMAPIHAGCFEMGDHFGEGPFDEIPVHEVCISDFEMDAHEVTNAEYAECVHVGACIAPTSWGSATRPTYYIDPTYDDFPVIFVDWHQADAYCAWAGKRLPTEAEWEYAARGGMEGKRYPWGNMISSTSANYLDSGDPWERDTSPVGYYAANGYGLYDVAGNVWEWVSDWLEKRYYQYCVDHGIVNDPPGSIIGTYRVVRGGSWSTGAGGIRVAERGGGYPTHGLNRIGFRCAR